MNRGFKFLIKPTKEQQSMFFKTFGCCRFVWNKMLSDKINAYNTDKTNLSVNPANYKEEFSFLKEIDSLALTSTWKQLMSAYSKFFKEPKVGFPKFKSKKHPKQSYTTNNQPASNAIRIENGKIKLPKIGWVIIKLHRQLPKDYEIKNVTISYYSGKFYASINVKYEPQIVSKKLDVQNSVGLDYKSDGLYVDNQGNEPDYPKFYRLYEQKLAFEQRKLSHMKRGSNNYYKQKIKVAKVHEKIANCRKDFLHKLSYEFANTYDYVFIEDIDLQSIAQFGHLGKSTNDNGFGIFRCMLSYKLQDRGKVFHKIDKWYASSTTCSNCGTKHKEIVNSLAVRKWTCPDCGYSHDRDINAAINIRNQGMLEIA
jgi:putative transposase